MKVIENIYFKKNQQYFQLLQQLVYNYPRTYINQLRSKKYKHILDWININLPLLSSDFYFISTKVYWILNGLKDFPTCIVCGTNEKYKKHNVTITRGYKKTCCLICAAKNPERQEKIKQTNIKKYGVENVFQDKNVIDKCKKSIFKKYGVEHPRQSKDIVKKTKNTCLTKYGNENFNNREKAKITCLTKYGVENPQQTEYVKQKTKQTNIEKYGWEYSLSNKDIIQKKKNTCIERYGVSTYIATNENKQNIRKKTYDKLCNDTDSMPMFSINEFDGSFDVYKQYQFRCKHCGNIFWSRYYNGHHAKCEKCFPGLARGKSNTEMSIFDFIKSIYTRKILSGSRSIIAPYELDIYIPDKHIAFEYDGLYWHSELNVENSKQHLNKTLLCEKQNIQLIHIFENEWLTKQDIVKNRIKNLLGIYDKVIYGRNCQIKEIDFGTSKEFQDQNHIQGSINAKVNLGLYYKDELVSLMTFGKCRFDKKHEYELLRFCNKLGYHIPGAASKLLNYFEKTYKPKSLVSYADRRWSQGKLYFKLNFQLSHTTSPNYWYWKNKQLKLFSRLQCQKHKLKNIIQNFDKNKTEVQNMHENGYYRIFDCGNLVFYKEYTNN